MTKMIKRGQLVWVDFENRRGSCQSGRRPAIVVQNNTGNRFSTTTLVIPITSRTKTKLPVHTTLMNDYDIASKGNIVMTEQLTVIDKSQILQEGKMLGKDDLAAMERALFKQLKLNVV